MPELPPEPDIDQLRHLAKDLFRAAQRGEPNALARVRAVSAGVTLTVAQLTVAREYGFASWPKLAREVVRREALDGRDVDLLKSLFTRDAALATEAMEHWADHPLATSPLAYVAMQRFDTASGLWRDAPGTAAVARALLESGASVDGDPADLETPLITAASYGDAEVARVLIEAGAKLDARSSAHSGGVPGGTALLHAAVFGMTDLVDVLVAAGAAVRSIEEAAATGELGSWLTHDTPLQARVRALVMAADHERVEVIDALVAAGTPVDATDEEFGRHPLRLAARNGRPASVRRLLAHGADPNLRDRQSRTPLALCREASGVEASAGHHEVEAALARLTNPS